MESTEDQKPSDAMESSEEMESTEEMESSDESSKDANDDEESHVATKEVAALKESEGKVTLVELITTTVPPTTVVTTTEMMAESVKTKDSEMDAATDMEDETITMVSTDEKSEGKLII